MLYPAIALALLCAAWMAVQLLAKKQQTKNHIDHGGGCCGACADKTCELKPTFPSPKNPPQGEGI